jgi:hypothetical protein
MSDGALAVDAAHTVDYVVGGEAGGFVDDEDAVHGGFGNLILE